MKKSFDKKVMTAAAVILMCTACGQNAPTGEIRETQQETTTSETTAVTTQETESVTEAETTAAETTAESKETEAETLTEETTEQTTAFGEGLPTNFDLDVPVDEELYGEYPDEAIIAQSVLNFYGVSCDVADVSGYCPEDTTDLGEKFKKTLEGYLSANGINDIVIENVPHDEMDTDRAMREAYNNSLVICYDYEDFDDLHDYYFPQIITGYNGYDDPNKKPEWTYLHFNTPWGYSPNGSGTMNGADVFEEKILTDTEHPIFIISKK